MRDNMKGGALTEVTFYILLSLYAPKHGYAVMQFIEEKTGGRLFCYRENPGEMEAYMAFFSSAIDTLQTLVIALGAGLGVWGVVNLLEGYGSDNPGSNAHVR